MASKLLLLGESNVGKSHFGGQLLGRLNREQGALRMIGSPPTLAPFEAVLDGLNNGRASAHTSASLYLESHWPIADEAGRRIDLVWPDYGGEQVRAIRADRRMPPEWRDRIAKSDGWIIMVRIQHAQLGDDLFSRPLRHFIRDPKPAESFTMSDQAKLVDFLQWLMFVRGSGTLVSVERPRLLLLLSCWDELPDDERNDPPAEVLRRRMPLVAAFVESNWRPGSRHVLGLSALERPLTEQSEDQDYIDLGPEAFGYVVRADGTHSPDLTLALTPLL